MLKVKKKYKEYLRSFTKPLQRKKTVPCLIVFTLNFCFFFMARKTDSSKRNVYARGLLSSVILICSRNNVNFMSSYFKFCFNLQRIFSCYISKPFA